VGVGVRGIAWRVVFGRPGGLRRRTVRELLRRLADVLGASEVVEAPSAAPTSVAGRDLMPAASLPPGTVTSARLGEEPVAVCRVGDEVFVLEDTCPHAGGSLGDGELQGGTLVCPDHGWPFDVRTGRCTLSPGVAVRRWPAWIADGRVVVAPDPLPPPTRPVTARRRAGDPL
jgi:nitrite reductase/ring-hydroxylating ferredoxin subunit